MGEYLLKLMITIPVLFFGFLAFIKWTQQNPLFTPKSTKLSIKDCLRVSPKATLQVVQVGSQYLLISVTEQDVTVLKELSEAESVYWSKPDIYQQDQLGVDKKANNELINLKILKEWKAKCLKKMNKK